MRLGFEPSSESQLLEVLPMTYKAPEEEAGHRYALCELALENDFQDVIIRARDSGWAVREICVALNNLCDRLTLELLAEVSSPST